MATTTDEKDGTTARRPSVIFEAWARVDDDSAMERLLAPVPEPHAWQLREWLKSGGCGRARYYHTETRSARYTACDGHIVAVFTVTEISLEQAATIEWECQSIKRWSVVAFDQAVERALGGTLTRVQ
jgi:hypothetical protein